MMRVSSQEYTARQAVSPAVRRITPALYILGFGFGWIAYAARGAILLPGWHNIFQGLSLLCLFICATLVVRNAGRLTPALPGFRFKTWGMVVLTLYMIIINIPLMIEYPEEMLGGMVKDLTPPLYILCGPVLGILSFRQRKIMMLVFLVFLGVGYATSRGLDVNYIAGSVNRRAAFQEVGEANVYSLQVAVGTTSGFMLLYALFSLRSLLYPMACSLGVLFWLYTSLIYSKRQGVGEIVIIGLATVSFLLIGKRLKVPRWLVLLLFLGIGGYGGFHIIRNADFKILFDRLFERVGSLGEEGFENFDRYRESKYYIDNTPTRKLIMGQGIGGISLSVISMRTIHIGWVNLLFKGGVFLVAFYVWVLVKNIKLAMVLPNFPNRFLGLFFPGYCLFRLLYAPSWSFLPSVFWLGFAFYSPEILFYTDYLLRTRPEKPLFRARTKQGVFESPGSEYATS